ncbi:MAG: FAD:protein FMN transferase [Candidatus Marinimicrobia bacterium]|jgi:thiamine biosynthesis lipoprotein|nr:FAD:protein FMN transferase [Candidatus Neomarinimicrobiota bacterium]
MIALDNYRVISINYKAQLMLGFGILGMLGCQNKSEEFIIDGYTMGTTYSVVYVLDHFHPGADLIQRKVDSLLNQLNQQMSTYIADSEISNFNSWKQSDPFAISSEFSEVVHRAQNISRLTNGAFDITVMPLVRLWGFGPEFKGSIRIPTEEEINKIKINTGSDKLVTVQSAIKKKNPELEIDLNAIAKGFAVDQMSILLETLNINNYLVEVGGEIRCRGRNRNGNKWSVGIDTPEFDNLAKRKIEIALSVSDLAVATSGDYRNYFEKNSKMYSHIIDPVTGHPAQSSIASATVIAPYCTEADAWATALLVLGKDGIKMIEELKDFEAILFIRKGELFQQIMTSGVKDMVVML